MHWNFKIEKYGIIRNTGIVSTSLNQTEKWIDKYKYAINGKYRTYVCEFET